MTHAWLPGMMIAASLTVVVSAEDWPQWRGPAGTGVSTETGLPERWSATENVAWRADLGGVGVSSPIVLGARVFVTSQLGAGTSRQGPRLAQGGAAGGGGERSLGAPRAAGTTPGQPVFLVEAFDRASGKRLWQYRLDAVGPMPTVHDKHNMASPSPVTDGERVYAWFGTGQIVALDLEGRLVWQRHLGKENGPFEINWGHSSSPTVFEDMVILLCDHDPASYLLAVDARTGRDRWKADRGRGRQSYSTPFVVRTPAGPELIVNSSQRVDATTRARARRSGMSARHTSSRFPRRRFTRASCTSRAATAAARTWPCARAAAAMSTSRMWSGSRQPAHPTSPRSSITMASSTWRATSAV
jgi:outer membrane protein assembly factor BamB